MNGKQPAVVPYGILPGNHDQPTYNFNKYFPYTRYEKEPWYGGHFPGNSNDNNYQLFSAGGHDFIVVNLEYNPSDEAISWAKEVLDEHSGRIAIIATHAYLDQFGGIHHAGKKIRKELVARCDNVRIVHTVCRRIDEFGDRVVYQLLSDYQSVFFDGAGFLRVMRFVPEEDRIYVSTYSPWLDKCLVDSNNRFILDFGM